MTPPPAGNSAVLLTAAGPGAIAVIRLTGSLNDAFAATCLTKPLRSMHCVYSDLIDSDGQIIDDVVAVRTDVGHIDLNVHAGPWVVQATLQLVERMGYVIRPAWQEAETFDASDYIERQMLIDLPSARSKATLRMLTAQPAAWRAMLADTDLKAMRRALADTTLAACLKVPAVAVVGPPNVGKSTLANALFGRERSITADRPGTTRDWVGEMADLDGVVVRLIDTPGVRATDDPIEAVAIKRAGRVVAAADCVVVVTDGSRPMTADEAATVATWRTSQTVASTLFVRTKTDLPNCLPADPSTIDLSALTGAGVDTLRAAIRTAVGADCLSGSHARCWTAEQRYKLRRLLNG